MQIMFSINVYQFWLFLWGACIISRHKVIKWVGLGVTGFCQGSQLHRLWFISTMTHCKSGGYFVPFRTGCEHYWRRFQAKQRERVEDTTPIQVLEGGKSNDPKEFDTNVPYLRAESAEKVPMRLHSQPTNFWTPKLSAILLFVFFSTRRIDFELSNDTNVRNKRKDAEKAE